MKQTLTKNRIQGILMVLAAASLWGISGTVAQVLFQQQGFSVAWLVAVRLLGSGFLLLLFASLQKTNIWAIWKDKQDRPRMTFFAFAGLLGVQYTYFAAVATGNATTATLLQFLGPAFITIYVALRLRKVPVAKDIGALLLAMLGTFLLVTNGSFKGLTVSGMAVFWGLTSAIAAAFYTLYPGQLLQKWSSTVVVGWGMFLSGVVLSILEPPVVTSTQVWSLYTVLLILFVILFGTLLAFYLYLDSLRHILPAEAGTLASAEPLSAAIVSVVWLNHVFGAWEMVGGVCILGTVFILSWKGRV